MKKLLKQLGSFYAKPFEGHPGLDLTYITDRIIVCSCPTTKTRKSLYCNSLDDLVDYLYEHHAGNWHLWNLRAELGDAYDVDDSVLENMITYFPWRDHEPPSFALLMDILQSILKFLQSDEAATAAIHCKLGKGRSGLIAVGVLVLKFGHTAQSAEALFTERRMRKGFGGGLSIQSQMRYANYVELSTTQQYAQSHVGVKVHSIRLLGSQKLGISSSTLSVQLHGLSEAKHSLDFREIGDSHFIYAPVSVRSVPLDAKIVIESAVSSKVLITSSFSFLCFNFHWESVAKSQHGDHSSTQSSAKKEVTHFTWEEFDGYKGSPKKGSRAFEKVELYWEFADNSTIS